MYGDGVIHLRSVQRWTHHFSVRRTELDVLARPGRPIGPENADRKKELPDSEPYFPQKKLSRRLSLHSNTIHRILTEEFWLHKVNFKGIPHSLTHSHNQEHVRISMERLPFLEEYSPWKLTDAFNLP
jgi:hypothetical protein